MMLAASKSAVDPLICRKMMNFAAFDGRLR
jgi:hypothetical protein